MILGSTVPNLSDSYKVLTYNVLFDLSRNIDYFNIYGTKGEGFIGAAKSWATVQCRTGVNFYYWDEKLEPANTIDIMVCFPYYGVERYHTDGKIITKYREQTVWGQVFDVTSQYKAFDFTQLLTDVNPGQHYANSMYTVSNTSSTGIGGTGTSATVSINTNQDGVIAAINKKLIDTFRAVVSPLKAKTPDLVFDRSMQQYRSKTEADASGPGRTLLSGDPDKILKDM